MQSLNNKYFLFIINHKYVSNITEISVSKIFIDLSVNFKLYIKELMGLSVLVGISEAIRL